MSRPKKIILLALVLVAGVVVAMRTQGPVGRPDTKIGIFVDDSANAQGTITSLQAQTGVTFSTVLIFNKFGQPNYHLDLGALSYVKSSGKNLMIAWEPWNPDVSPSDTTDYLTAINSGKEDPGIHTFAQDIKRYGAPVTIRFGHEMNGNWYPWAQRPQEYVSAYRHVVDLFRQAGITNVTWMWTINAESVPLEPITNVAQYYPGDDYVDVVGIDGYNFGTSQEDSVWRSFSTIFSKAYSFVTGYHKPIVISETASGEQGGNKAKWITQMARDLKTRFPKVSEFVWFNINKETDWRIESSPSSLAAFKSAFGR